MTVVGIGANSGYSCGRNSSKANELFMVLEFA